MITYPPRIPALTLLVLSLAVPAGEAGAQTFPSRPIRIVVPTSTSMPPDSSLV
jgi:hypothetical protein